MKTLNTPRLAQNAHFAHIGAPMGCQRVVLSVHMAKTRHSGRMFWRKTAGKRPNRDRIRISATEFNQSKALVRRIRCAHRWTMLPLRMMLGSIFLRTPIPRCGGNPSEHPPFDLCTPPPITYPQRRLSPPPPHFMHQKQFRLRRHARVKQEFLLCKTNGL
jgi:hypothetical protein